MAETKRTVLVALAANLAIAAAKFAGAALTGSAGMLAEGFHSLVDTGNQGFLFLGLHLQGRPRSPAHPMGYGRERFFWSFVAAIFIFAGGSLLSLQHGIAKWQAPEPIGDYLWAYAILGFALLAEGTSLGISLRQALGGARRRRQGLWGYLRRTPDATLLTVVLEDSGAIVGLLLAASGLGLTQLTGDARWDALATMLIGVLLAILAFILGGRAHSLLIGQAADTRTLERIDHMLGAAPFVDRVVDAYTSYLSPESLILAAHVQVREGLSTREASDLVAGLEAELARQIPSLRHIFIEIEPGERAGAGTS